MNISTLSFLLFLIATLVHFTFPSVGKVPITIQVLSDVGATNAYNATNWQRLLLYYAIVVVSQFMINSLYLINKCTGSVGENIGYAAYITLGPWTLIFAILLVVLNGFPDLKSAFSDVFGYFVIAGRANELFANLLVGDETTQEKIDGLGTDPASKTALINTTNAIVKIMGDKSVVVNQINLMNFMQMWKVLTPLMKPGVSPEQTDVYKQELLKIVETKDSVGEIMWYIYAGILVVSIVSYKLTTKECAPSLVSMKQNEEKYTADAAKIKQSKDVNNSQTVIL